MGGETVGEEREELLRRLVRPVQILPDEDQRPVLGRPDEDPAHRVEDLRSSERRIQLAEGRLARIHRQDVAHARERRPEVLSELQDRALHFLDDDPRRIRLVEIEGPPQEVDQRMERDRPAEGDRMAFHPGRPTRQVAPELPQEPGLADPGVPPDGDHLALTGPNALESIE